MRKLITNKGKFAASLLLAGVLTMGTVGAALAGGPAQESEGKRGYFGNITAKNEGSFTVNTKANTEIRLVVDQETQFRVPGAPEASFEDLALGSRVAILAEQTDGTLTAIKVMPVPAEPQREHRVLTVVEASGRTVIAQDEQGNQVEVALEQAVDEELTGQMVTFIGDRTQRANQFNANAGVRIGQVIQRLEAQSHRAQERLNETGEYQQREKQERDLARLHERLESLMQRHLDRFSEIIDRAPEQARPHLEHAREMSLKGYRAALEALERSQEHIEAELGHRTVQGMVSSIDTDAGRITVETRRGATLDLDIRDDTRVRMDGRDVGLPDLAPGDLVAVKYNLESSIATDIRIKTEAEAKGVIQSVDGADNELTIELSDETTLTLTATGQSEVEMNGEQVSLDELPAGAMVEVKYNPATQEILEIEVETRAEVEGTITLVDTGANEVTIITEDGAELTLAITDSTRVRIERILFGLTGLSEGMMVEAKYNLATGEALEIKAEAQDRDRSGDGHEAQVTGTLTNIDAEAGEVTITLDSGSRITLKLDADTKIELKGEDNQSPILADLLDRPKVRVEYDTESKVVSEIETLGRGRSGDRDSRSPSGAPKVLPSPGF